MGFDLYCILTSQGLFQETEVLDVNHLQVTDKLDYNRLYKSTRRHVQESHFNGNVYRIYVNYFAIAVVSPLNLL